jgi:hypothetical protein
MNRSTNPYQRHRFPPAIIRYAVWLYHRFNLSHRDIEDLLAERGIEASYESVRLPILVRQGVGEGGRDMVLRTLAAEPCNVRSGDGGQALQLVRDHFARA